MSKTIVEIWLGKRFSPRVALGCYHPNHWIFLLYHYPLWNTNH